MTCRRLGLVAVETHPIQYKAPLFRRLALDPRLDLAVLYAMLPDAAQQGAGFGVPFEWDVPLRDGYRSEVLENRAKHPSVTAFSGCDTPGIEERLRVLRPDAVLLNGWVVKTCLQALWACKRLGIPCLVRGEANLLRPRAGWKHALQRMLIRQYDAWLAIGSANREFYRFHRCPEERIFWTPYAVDNDFFAAQAAVRAGRRAEIRAGFGLPPEATVFLFAGKLEAKKRPLDLLEAFSLLPADLRAKAHLLVVGDGPLHDACEQVARERHLPVSFAGFLNQSRLPDAYAAADVLVLPSDAGETWGLVVNEAMASGRPAVVSRAAGCCADLVVAGETGQAFDLGNVPALAEILAEYLRNPGLAASQGGAASRHVQSFCFERIATGIRAGVSACVRSNPICGGEGAGPC
ncbi:MAG: glycosyltransferase family 4 protein [Kiritimatiellia bacterium]